MAEVEQALKALGTNVVPFLLNEAFSTFHDSPLSTNLLTATSTLLRPLGSPPFRPSHLCPSIGFRRALRDQTARRVDPAAGFHGL